MAQEIERKFLVCSDAWKAAASTAAGTASTAAGTAPTAAGTAPTAARTAPTAAGTAPTAAGTAPTAGTAASKVGTAASTAGPTGVRIRQGYLSTSSTRSVRVRTAGARATLAVKGSKVGPRAVEFEYPIPLEDARQLLSQLCLRPLIEKTRYDIPAPDGHLWEVDEFHAENAGLVVAEIELSHEDQEFVRPSWVGEEVTDDPRYLNTNLVERPFAVWGRKEGSGDEAGSGGQMGLEREAHSGEEAGSGD